MAVQGNLIPQGELKDSLAAAITRLLERPRKSNSPRGIERITLAPSVSARKVQGNLIPQGELKDEKSAHLGRGNLIHVQGNLIPQGELKVAGDFGPVPPGLMSKEI